MKRFLRWGIPLLLLLGLAMTWGVGSLLTRPTNRTVPDFPAPAEEVQFRSAPGVNIAGTYWAGKGEAPGAILVLHGNGSDRAGIATYAELLAAEGYSVLAIDFRGHGESSPSHKSFGWFEAEDARAGLAWLKARNPDSKLGAVGLSLGGAASVLGPEGPLQVDALVLNAVYPNIRTAIHNRIAAHTATPLAYVIEPMLSYQSVLRLGISPEQISPIKALKSVSAPVLVVGGSEDIYTPPNETAAMFEAANRNGEFWILCGLGHNQAVGSLSPEFKSKLLAFLGRHLKKN